MAPDEQARLERARWEGTVDSRLAAHDHRFAVINGAIERLADAVDKLTHQQALAIEVAKALAEQHEQARTRWKGWREIVAWTLGVIIAVASVATLTSRLLGLPTSEKPSLTTTTTTIIYP